MTSTKDPRNELKPCHVLVAPGDTAAPGKYRCIFPAEALAAKGYDVQYTYQAWLKGMFELDKTSKEMQLVQATMADFEVLVVQRVVSEPLLIAMRWAKAHGRKIVMDIDDDVMCIHPSNKAFPYYQHRHALFTEGVRLADVLTCSTPELADRYGGVVLRNCIPASYLATEPIDEPHGLGWAGTIDVHPNDLQATRGQIPKWCAKNNEEFRVVGLKEGVGDALGFKTDIAETGWLDIKDYPAHVASLRTGIVPLDSSRFNRAKSYLKGLEYAALGVPFVASDLPEYRYLASQGVGVLAEGNKWYGPLDRCKDDREELVADGLAYAERQTYEQNCEAWWETWVQP